MDQIKPSGWYLTHGMLVRQHVRRFHPSAVKSRQHAMSCDAVPHCVQLETAARCRPMLCHADGVYVTGSQDCSPSQSKVNQATHCTHMLHAQQLERIGPSERSSPTLVTLLSPKSISFRRCVLASIMQFSGFMSLHSSDQHQQHRHTCSTPVGLATKLCDL